VIECQEEVTVEELDKGLEIEMRGAAARRALAACKKQIAKWRIPLPPVKPLILDFGLGDFKHTGLIEFWIANEPAGYCGKYLFVFDGQQCPVHHHRVKHETFFVAAGTVAMKADGRSRTLKQGDVFPVAPGRRHGFQGKGPALLLELSTVCRIRDNYFENPAIHV
jgi:D-lyxose ketol-isomerase